MRILRIDLRAKLLASNPSIRFDNQDVRRQFYHEMEGLIPELSETSRRRIASYFPSEYSVFVRMALQPESDTAKILVWVDDPTIRWPAGLLARRAWKLSVPVLSHAISETFEQRIQGISMQFEKSGARIASLAPMRFWGDSIVLILGVFAVTTVFWLYALPFAMARLTSGAPGP